MDATQRIAIQLGLAIIELEHLRDKIKAMEAQNSASQEAAQKKVVKPSS